MNLFVYKSNLKTEGSRYSAHLGQPCSYGIVKKNNLELIDIYLKVENSKLNFVLEEIYSFKGSDEKLKSKLTKILF